MRKVKLQPTKPSGKPEEKLMKVSSDTSNYKPKGSPLPSNVKQSMASKLGSELGKTSPKVIEAIKAAKKRGGLD